MSTHIGSSGSSRCNYVNQHFQTQQSNSDQLSFQMVQEQQSLSYRLRKRYSTKSISMIEESSTILKTVAPQTARIQTNNYQQQLNTIQNSGNSVKTISKQMYSSNPHQLRLSNFSTNESQAKMKNSTSPDQEFFETLVNDDEFFPEQNEIQVDKNSLPPASLNQQLLHPSLQISEQQNPIELVKRSYQKLQHDIFQEQIFGNKPNCVPHYAFSVTQTLNFLQLKTKISEIKEKTELAIRETLMDQMCLLHTELKLSSETFFLAGNILALYLEGQKISQIQQSKLAVLIATCLFISAKYEEIYPPSLKSFSQTLEQFLLPHTPSTSLSKLILDQEGIIFTQLGFSLFNPTRFQFFEAFMQLSALDMAQKCFCSYLLELSQLNHSFYKYKHSEVAAAAILLSEKFKNISGRYFWSSDLEVTSTFKQQDLYSCVEELYQYLLHISQNKKQFYLYQKYSQVKYKSVALIDYDLTNNINNQQNAIKQAAKAQAEKDRTLPQYSFDPNICKQDLYYLKQSNSNNIDPFYEQHSYTQQSLPNNISTRYSSKLNLNRSMSQQLNQYSSAALKDYSFAHFNENAIAKDYQSQQQKMYDIQNSQKDCNYPMRTQDNKENHNTSHYFSSEYQLNTSHNQKKKKGSNSQQFSLATIQNINNENIPLSNALSQRSSFSINKPFDLKKFDNKK